MIRIFDTAVAVVGLVLASPLLAIAAVGIKLSSRGPVVYRARRAGLEGQQFSMFKLRTMHVGVSGAGRITGGGDPRVFRWGAMLRAVKLDEVPQLLNVVRGEMALVGPRPEDASIVIDHYDEFMRESLKVRPGVTGPGALDYANLARELPADPTEAERLYLDSLLARKIALDLVYVRNRSFRYHVELVCRTLLSMMGVTRPFDSRRSWELTTARSYMVEASR